MELNNLDTSNVEIDEYNLQDSSISLSPRVSSPKRLRFRTTPQQLRILTESFALYPKPDGMMRKQLAEQLQMSERSVQIWFQNKRAKLKTMSKLCTPSFDKSRRLNQNFTALYPSKSSAFASMVPAYAPECLPAPYQIPFHDDFNVPSISDLPPADDFWHPASNIGVYHDVADRNPHHIDWNMSFDRNSVFSSEYAHAQDYRSYR